MNNYDLILKDINNSDLSLEEAVELINKTSITTVNQPEPTIEVIEVTMTEYNYYGVDSLYARFYKCPKCDSEYVVEKDKYCSNCGVKLNWE